MMGSASFADEQAFVIAFIEYLEELFTGRSDFSGITETEAFLDLTQLKEKERISLDKIISRVKQDMRKIRKPLGIND